MQRSNKARRGAELLSAGSVLLCILLAACQGFSADYGRVSGKVTDSAGNPIMGATVLLSGPGIDMPSGLLEGSLDRVFTDAQGKFTIGRVAPGWYSLQVISPAKLPGFRDKVEVRPGLTTREAFALGDVLSGFHWPRSASDSHAWDQGWKWILRTSASTRPILRYRKADHGRQDAAEHTPLPAQRIVAMLPGSSGANGLSRDSGTGTLVAYLHPLDVNSDVLVAGSVDRSDADGSSILAEYRRGLLNKNHEDISLGIHQLEIGGAVGPVKTTDGQGLSTSRGMVLRYVQTRQLSDALTLTAGFEMKYLNSAGDAGTTQPEIDLAYTLDPSTVLSLSFGAGGLEQPDTLLKRIGDLDAFPQITLHNFRPRLEAARHAEVRLHRKLRDGSRVEFAAYHDGFQDVAVWGVGGVEALANSTAPGNVLVTPGGARAVFNAGRYGSSGAEVAYKQQLGQRGEIGVMYAFGSALSVDPSTELRGGLAVNAANLLDYLRTQLTQTVSGRFSTSIPGLNTQVISTYSWLPAGRLTVVDPYGQSRMEFQPFLGVQIRQPLPKIDMLPLRIVAIADFRNLLGQGSVSMRQADGTSVLLTPAYRTVRGGFAVQF
ncbi:MAG: carboxypeptidase regulatory-like domain-containing protein [Acidobacteria bacterium]|nr:MAG: carboxypeptidase regulatory-like domain-containing protein [Acidobacteriota bacterium]